MWSLPVMKGGGNNGFCLRGAISHDRIRNINRSSHCRSYFAKQKEVAHPANVR